MNNPLFLLLGAAAAGIVVIMYLIKEKHSDQLIPSVFLWSEVIKNAQNIEKETKFRKNLLMFLQIFILLMMGFLLSQPSFKTIEKTGDYVLIFDISATGNGVVNGEENITRYKDEAISFLTDKSKESNVSIITYGLESEVLVNGKLSDIDYKNIINEVKTTSAEDDYNVLLNIIKSVKETNEKAIIKVYSDKVEKQDLSEVFDIEITDLYITSKGDEIVSIATNNGEAFREVELSIYADNHIVDVFDTTLKPKEIKILKTKLEKKPEKITATLPKDDFVLNNTRTFIPSDKNQRSILLVTKGNIFLEKALMVSGASVFKTNNYDESMNGYDVYVIDSLETKIPDDGSVLIINYKGESNLYKGEFTKDSGVITYEDDLFSIGKDKISVSGYTKLEAIKEFSSVAKINGDSIIIKGKKGANKYIIMGFDLFKSDFAMSYEFPLFIYNSVDYLVERRDDVDTTNNINTSSEKLYVKKAEEFSRFMDGLDENEEQNKESRQKIWIPLLVIVLLLILGEWVVFNYVRKI